MVQRVKIGSQGGTAMLQPARKGGESDFDKWLWKGKKMQNSRMTANDQNH